METAVRPMRQAYCINKTSYKNLSSKNRFASFTSLSRFPNSTFAGRFFISAGGV